MERSHSKISGDDNLVKVPTYDEKRDEYFLEISLALFEQFE